MTVSSREIQGSSTEWIVQCMRLPIIKVSKEEIGRDNTMKE